MRQQPKTGVTDAQLGRALREYLATTRGLAVVRDDTDDLPPFRLVRDDRPEGAAPWEVVTVRHTARSLFTLLDEFFNDVEATGHDVALDELFEDADDGFDLNGLSLGTFAVATQLAPGAPIPRELLTAVNAYLEPRAPGEPEPKLASPEPQEWASVAFVHPARRLAEATVEHLCDGGVFLRATDDFILVHPDIGANVERTTQRIAQALVEQAVIAVAAQLFADKQHALLRRLQPHLTFVTDQRLLLATPRAMTLAFLCADYYTTVEPDLERLRHYVTQGCAVLDLVIDALDPMILPWIAHDLYGLAKVAHDAGMLDVAQLAYVRSFELRWRRQDAGGAESEDDDDWGSILLAPASSSPAMDWVVAELALDRSLETDQIATARSIPETVRRRAEAEGDLIGLRQAEYLRARIAAWQGEEQAAIERLYRIVGWCYDRSNDPGELVQLVDGLLVVFIELARLEVSAGGTERAERLLTWAANALDSAFVQENIPDQPDNPNDTRHRLRARLLQTQAVLAAAQRDHERAMQYFEAAQRLIHFALGESTAEAQQLAQQSAALLGEPPA
jgi:hypothetical protein